MRLEDTRRYVMKYNDKWLRFKEGFLSVWRLLYPPGQDMDWYAQIGRICGALALVELWRIAARGIMWVFS